MNIWFRQHRFALGAALAQVRKAPGSFLFNVLVVAVALALPFAGLTLLDNVRPMSEQLSVDPEISLFMKPEAPREQAQAWRRSCARSWPAARRRSASSRASRRWKT
jgi:cell division transport system permease protein